MTTSWVVGWLLVGVAVAILMRSLLKRRREARRKLEQADLQLWDDERDNTPGGEPMAGSDAETMPAVLNPEEWRKRG